MSWRSPNVGPIDTERRFEVKLTSDKWIRVCEKHFLFFQKQRYAIRTDYKEPTKLDSFEKSLVAKLTSGSIQSKPIPVSQVLTPDQNKHKKDNMQRTQGTLDFHVLEVIKLLNDDGLTFSGYDVTKRLRKRINDGEVEITGRPFSTIRTPGGSSIQSQRVEHNEVRDRVHYFFEQNTFPHIDRTNNGTYWEYHPKTAVTAAPTNSSGIFAGVVQPSAPTTNVVTAIAPPAPVAPVAVAPPADPIVALTKDTKPLLRLRCKKNQEFITLPNGRSAWARRCDITQALMYGKKNRPVAQTVRDGISSGEIEVVPV